MCQATWLMVQKDICNYSPELLSHDMTIAAPVIINAFADLHVLALRWWFYVQQDSLMVFSSLEKDE